MGQPRHKRPSGLSLLCAGLTIAVGSGLLLWLPSRPVSSSAERLQPEESPTSSERRFSVAMASSRGEAFVHEAVTAAAQRSRDQREGTWSEALHPPRRERPEFLGSSPETTEAATSMEVPMASEEVLPDGLPAAGLRCSLDDAGTFVCGGCRLDSDCPSGQGCVPNRETRRFECMASDCEEEGHCLPGFLCLSLNPGTSGALVRRCTPEGQRRAGEPCEPGYISPTGSCREGLVCLEGRCSVRCRVDEPSSCPAGHTCEDTPDGPGCHPDCRKLGCDQGQRCKRLGEDGHYQCLTSVQGECPETPCGEGERCNFRLFRGRGIFWCARLCNPLRADTCPEDQLCGMGSATVSTCFRRCDPLKPDSCGEGWRCATVSEDMKQWGCMPASKQ
jgi:hypothetical protein